MFEHRSNSKPQTATGVTKRRAVATGPIMVIFLALFALAIPSRGQNFIEVEAATRPGGGSWKKYPTSTIAQSPELAALTPDSSLDRYGGNSDHQLRATGFFYTTNILGRWWFVDPLGHLFIHKGVSTLKPLHTPGSEQTFRTKFGSDANWGLRVTELLRENGFNGAGAWSSLPDLRVAPEPLVYTRILNFMVAYGRKRGGTYQQPGHTGFPNDCVFVFDPGFETFCDEYAQQLAADKDDPYLLGHFSDNELPFKHSTLTNYLSLPATDAGHQAAEEWLRSRHGEKATAASITEQDNRDFLSLVVARYFRIVSRAIHKYDPNHLFLGSRFYGPDINCPEIFKASGPYLDVVSVNYYYVWTPKQSDLAMWSKQSGRPILITEWYAKGEDSGLPNHNGAGWVVKTQRDRGLFYQNFTLGLLSSSVCVGWHWLQYADNDPADTKTDPSNRDANKGIVNIRFEPYVPLLEAMKQVNERSYALAHYFQSSGPDRNRLEQK